MRWVFISIVLMNLAYLGYELSSVEGKSKPQESLSLAPSNDASNLELISELARPTAKKPVGTKSELCWAVGDFASELDAKHVYARMLALDIPARIQERDKLLKQEFWVYLPPLPNKKQALRKLKELQRRKIDSYIITEGDLANGISLGLFGKQDSVDRLVAKLKKKQISASVKTLDRRKSEYWVMAPVNGDVVMDDPMRKRLTGTQLNLEWQQVRCVEK